MDFITIDFETANDSRDSICSVGLAKFKNGILVDTMYSLIDPEDYFDGYNIAIHGITEQMVIDAPTFPDFYPSLKEFVDGETLVAHFSSFDMSVLRHACDKYNMDYPTFNYSCTYQLSKKILPGEINYKLNSLAKKYNIQFEHHNALEDAKACGSLLVKLFEEAETDIFDDLLKKANLNWGKMFPGGYRGSRTRKTSKSSSHSLDKIATEITEFDEDHIFFDKMFAFTGALSSMTRKEAAQRVVDLGALCGNGVTKQTNFLVIGDYDLDRFGDGFKSSKLKKAEKLLSEGQDIEIVGESEFLKML